MGKEIEVLKHHPDFASLQGDETFGQAAKGVPFHPMPHDLSRDDHETRCRLFKKVDATQKCRLPRTGWSDDRNGLTALHLKVDASEYLVRSERFPKVTNGDPSQEARA